MSFSTLSIGVSALNAAQRAVETAAHNVANSAVEGYTRQRLSVTAAPPGAGTAGMRGSGMLGTGVTVVSIDRLRSTLADVSVRSEAATAGSAGARAAVLDRSQGILGAYGSGLSQSLSNLFSAFSQLALTPSDAAARQLTLDAASRVAAGVRDAAQQLDQIRADALAGLQSSVTEVNASAVEIADLNKQIADALVGGQAPNDLLDRRDLALDRLAGLTGATSRVRPDGMVDVSIGTETLVRGTGTTPLVLTQTPPPEGASGADPVLTLDGRAVAAGGALGGGVGVMVSDLRQFETELDGVASAVATAINDQQTKGYDADGQAGQALFVGTKARDLAVAPDLGTRGLAASATQVDGGSAYDGENALALARLGDPDATGRSLNGRLIGLAATLGSRAASAARAADTADAGLDGVQQQRSAANGVSVDEEMVDLVKFQHAYDAAARVISIADDMLDTIIHGLGAGR